MTGSSCIIISKVDILVQVGLFKLIHGGTIIHFDSIIDMQDYIKTTLHNNCQFVKDIIFSDSPETVMIP